jgi:hypothetical protein
MLPKYLVKQVEAEVKTYEEVSAALANLIITLMAWYKQSNIA